MSDQNEQRSARRREVADQARRRERESLSRTDVLCRDLGPEPRGLARAREELRRLDRIAERDPLRRSSDFRPERVRALEALEIRDTPEAFARRHEGQGLDEATRRELCKALQGRETDRPRRGGGS
jgi:hypothetical protein